MIASRVISDPDYAIDCARDQFSPGTSVGLMNINVGISECRYLLSKIDYLYMYLNILGAFRSVKKIIYS